MPAAHSASPIDSDGVVRCYTHGLEAILLTSRTASNPNRFIDVKRTGQTAAVWADELSHAHKLAAPPMSPSTTRSSQSQDQSAHHLPATPRKRAFDSTSLPTPHELTPSQKRKKIMEEALAAQPTPSQSRAVHSISKREEGDDDDEDLPWAALTPPSSLPANGNRTGKADHNHGPEASGSRHTAVMDADTNPFIASSQDSQLTIGPLTANLNGKGSELSADAISALWSKLDGIPEYVRKLERKKIAAEKSSDAKTKRISELEAELRRLKERNIALDQALRALAST